MSSERSSSNLLYLISQKNTILRQETDETWESHGKIEISPSEWIFLTHVFENQETLSEIARSRGMTRQAAHKFYKNLEAKALLTVSPQNSTPRNRTIALTPLGKDYYNEYLTMQKKIEATIADTLGEKNIALLKEILSQDWLQDNHQHA